MAKELLVCVALAGCSSPVKPVGGADASVEVGAVDSGAADSGAACSAIDLSKVPPVVHYASADPTPMPTGGTISPGTYFVTKSTLYDGTTQGPLPGERWVEIFGATTWEGAVIPIDGGEPDSIRYAGTWETKDHFLTRKILCPSSSSGALSGDYSVLGPTALLLFQKRQNDVITYELTRQ